MAVGIARSSTQAAIKDFQRPAESAVEGPPANGKAPRVGHKKSRKGCAQCKRRHVKCNEEKPCSNCVRHNVACSLAGGPQVEREDAKPRRQSTTSSSTSNVSKTTSQEPATLTPTASASDSRRASPRPSPFHALTGWIDRPSPGEDKQWILDLELMHHFMMYTRDIMTENQGLDYILQIWQVEMPKVAFAHDYVMHGLLGFAALHKAHIEPAKAATLRQSAVDHLDKALVLYRSENAPATSENSNAKFTFTWIVALFAYAIPPTLPPIDAMVELFMLVKGIDASLTETWFWVSQGPFAPILTRGFQEAISTPLEGYSLPEGMDFGLGHLDFMLSVDVMLPEDRRTCTIILTELKQVYESVLRSQGTCSVAAILCFPKQDSGKFAQMIKRRVSQALVILAYYCVLLDILDTRWWIHGWSTRVLRDVVGTLDEQWRHWIEWPVQSVLSKQRSPVLDVGMDINVNMADFMT